MKIGLVLDSRKLSIYSAVFSSVHIVLQALNSLSSTLAMQMYCVARLAIHKSF